MKFYGDQLQEKLLCQENNSSSKKGLRILINVLSSSGFRKKSVPA
jgi:hypothetical protein